MNLKKLMPNRESAKLCGKVAVLLGGTSAEREVSLKSGNAVYTGLIEAGVDAFKLDVGGNILQQLSILKADRVFNILHGRGGEDGSIQAVLEMIGMPYTGSDVCASALAMDKLATKRILIGCDIPTPDYFELSNEFDCQQLLCEFGLPVFIKPVLEGSSIGMTPVHRAEDLIPAWQKASGYGDVFAERFVTGAEYTAGFIGDRVLPLIKLETPREFYDYQAKYLVDDTIYTCPSGLPNHMVDQINDLVMRTVHVTGVRHWGRIDLMLDELNQPWIIEVNTVPGMTDHSLVPMAARVAGLEMPDLVLKILELTLNRGGSHV